MKLRVEFCHLHAMSLKFNYSWGMECLNIRFPMSILLLPTEFGKTPPFRSPERSVLALGSLYLLYAGYSAKLK